MKMNYLNAFHTSYINVNVPYCTYIYFIILPTNIKLYATKMLITKLHLKYNLSLEIQRMTVE